MEETVSSLEIKDLKKKLFNTNLKSFMLILFLILELIVIITFLVKKDLLPFSQEKAGDKIAVVNFNQEITVDYVHSVIEQIDKVIKKESYKEVVILMNSPGGSPSASEEMSEYLKKVKTEKPITMYIESVAASGGYYIASAIKPLKANRNAVIGSIGVIMPHYNAETLAEKIGIKEDYIAAGKFKKPVSMFKPIDEENKEYLTNNMILPIYENFISAVAENRELDRDLIKDFAEGTVYIASDPSIKNILVDEITSLAEVKKSLIEKYGKEIKFINLKEVEDSPFSSFGINVNISAPDFKNSFNLK